MCCEVALMPAAKSLTAVRKIVCKKCQLCKTLLKTNKNFSTETSKIVKMNCNEEIQDRVPVGDMSKLSDSAKEELQQQMMDCANSCFVQFRKKFQLCMAELESRQRVCTTDID